MKTGTLLIACALALAPWPAAAQTKDAPSKPAPKKSAPKAPAMKKTTAATCTGAMCPVSVFAPNCAASADPDVLTVKTANVIVRWTIQTKGYTFPETDGIFFKGTGAGEAFDQCRRVNETVWECRDKNAVPGPVAFKYGINVLKPDKTACPTLDPTIINDP